MSDRLLGRRGLIDFRPTASRLSRFSHHRNSQFVKDGMTPRAVPARPRSTSPGHLRRPSPSGNDRLAPGPSLAARPMDAAPWRGGFLFIAGPGARDGRRSPLGPPRPTATGALRAPVLHFVAAFGAAVRLARTSWSLSPPTPLPGPAVFFKRGGRQDGAE